MYKNLGLADHTQDLLEPNVAILYQMFNVLQTCKRNQKLYTTLLSKLLDKLYMNERPGAAQ